jgi:Bacterial SH3 domain
MKNPIFFILCILLLTCACTNTSEKANDIREITTPLDSPNIDSLFRQTMEIEAHKADYDQIRATIKAANWEDSTRLQLFLAKQKPKMLTFTTFDDAGEPAGEGVYYFDQTAFPFAEKISGGEGAFYSVFFKDGGFVPFSNINSTLKLQESNNFARNYRRALSAKEINVFMQKFPTIKYQNISFDQDSSFLLKTLSNLRLRTAPSISSNTIVVIPKDSLVQFLAATTLTDTVETMSWIWYKVKMQKSNQIGWVFGHPKYLMVVDDEHY